MNHPSCFIDLRNESKSLLGCPDVFAQAYKNECVQCWERLAAAPATSDVWAWSVCLALRCASCLPFNREGENGKENNAAANKNHGKRRQLVKWLHNQEGPSDFPVISVWITRNYAAEK